MVAYVALLRAVNVGGHRKLPMADLRAVVAEAGGSHVRTHIQSGNVVFADDGRSPEAIRADLEGRLGRLAGFEVPVALRSAAELETVVAENPLPHVPTDQLHVAFFHEDPPPRLLDGIDTAAFEPEQLLLVGRQLYLSLPNGVGRGKLPPVVARLPAPTTSRTWKTVTALAAMAAEIPTGERHP